MKGFTVDIAGRPSPAETFLGGALVIELVPDPNNAGHYGPGKARVGAVTLTRTDENRTDWSDWFKASNETQGGERRNVTVAFTDQTGAIVMVFMLWGALPVWQGFTLDGKGTDVDVEEIRLCVEEFERG
jgi:phage tail-like protein